MRQQTHLEWVFASKLGLQIKTLAIPVVAITQLCKSLASHCALEECAILALWVYFSAGSAQPSQLALYRTIGQGQP